MVFLADKSGATGTIALVVDNVLYVANVGDSSAIICQKGIPIHLTTEHKASVETEKLRIKEAGGLVVWYGGWRVNGTSAVSRSIGDEPLSDFLIAEPSIIAHRLQEDDDFLVLASDGLWDVLKV
jgi:protein phosphatase 1L